MLGRSSCIGVEMESTMAVGSRPRRHVAATLDIDRLNRRRRKHKQPVPREELTSEQMAECRDLFKMFDSNRDDSLGRSEFGPMMRTLGLHLTERELDMFFDRIDGNGDNAIAFEELTTFLEKIGRPLTPEEELVEAYRIFASDAPDHGSDGRTEDEDIQQIISKAGLARVFASMGEDISEAECASMITGITGGSEAISFHDFARLCDTPMASAAALRGSAGGERVRRKTTRFEA